MVNKNTVIDRFNINDLSVADFKRYYLLANKPVILSNIFNKKSSLIRWDPEYLIEKLGNKIVKVNTSPSNTFFLDPNKGGFFTPPVKIGFKDYITKIQNPHNKQILYMQQVSIIRELQELKSCFNFPKYIDPSQIHIDEVCLWVSPGGNTAPLHYDQDNNFFIQSFGSKKFIIYPPWEFYNLYPYCFRSMAPHLSKVNINNFNLFEYSNFKKAKPVEFTISNGEMLFLPAYWWHQVFSIDFTISINIWWPPLLKQNLVPGALHLFLHNWYHKWKNLFY